MTVQTNPLERIPPQSIEAEQAALGAMLLEREAISRADELGLTTADFYRISHRMIFQGIMKLYQRHEPVDLITLGEQLRTEGLIEEIGGTLYLTTLMSQVPTAAGIEYYVQIVRDRAVMRDLIKQADRIMEQVYKFGSDGDINALMDEAEDRLWAVRDRYHGKTLELQEWYDVEAQFVLERKRADERGFDTGFKTPLKTLNQLLLPVRPKELIIVAARPGGGKTSFGEQWAYTAAADQGMRGLFVSIEMSAEELAERRLLASTGLSRFSVDFMPYRKNHPDRVYPALEDAVGQSLAIPLLVLDAPRINCREVMAHARRARRRLDGLDFILVDYAQKMASIDGIKEDTPRVAAVARELKAMAKELGVAVIALAQINREGVGSKDTRPELHQLKQSGDLEQEADKVLALHVPDHQEPERVEIGILKQRNGPTGWRTIGFCPRRTWFYNSPADVPGDAAEEGGEVGA